MRYRLRETKRWIVSAAMSRSCRFQRSNSSKPAPATSSLVSSRGERQRSPPAKDSLGIGAQLILDHRARQLRSHRRSVVLQSRDGGAKGLGHVLIDVARHLAKLHECAFHGAELLRHVVGRTQGKLMAKLGATVHRSEDQTR